MSRRTLPILILLAAVALACANSAGQPLEQSQATLPADSAVGEPAQTSQPTENTLFLPDISAETTPGGQDQPDTPVEPTSSTLFLPDISSGGTPQAGVETAPTPAGDEAYIEIQLDRTEIEVGETLVVTGRPVNIGLPYYFLVVEDEGADESLPLVQVTYDNQVTPMDGTSQVLELVSAEGRLDQVIFVLRGKAPGSAAASISATGEVQEGGGMSWSGGGSEAAVITVEE